MEEQWQLERSSTRSCPYVGDVLSFCSAQAGFRARQHCIKYVSYPIMRVVFHFDVLFPFVQETVMFRVFQLTAVLIRGPATCGERFIHKIDRVAIKEEEVRGVLLCEQDFVSSPHFTQRSFLSESGLTMLSDSVDIADCITSSPFYSPGSLVGTACAGQVMTDLRACWDRIILRRRTAKETSERW